MIFLNCVKEKTIFFSPEAHKIASCFTKKPPQNGLYRAYEIRNVLFEHLIDFQKICQQVIIYEICWLLVGWYYLESTYQYHNILQLVTSTLIFVKIELCIYWPRVCGFYQRLAFKYKAVRLLSWEVWCFMCVKSTIYYLLQLLEEFCTAPVFLSLL